jgi:hypothetical protein
MAATHVGEHRWCATSPGALTGSPAEQAFALDGIFWSIKMLITNIVMATVYILFGVDINLRANVFFQTYEGIIEVTNFTAKAERMKWEKDGKEAKEAIRVIKKLEEMLKTTSDPKLREIIQSQIEVFIEIRDHAPAVSLLLNKASAEQLDKEDILFRCEVELDNATGRDLTVKSMFFSAFDGLQVVVTTPEGKVLAQQGYTFHQSPYTAPGRDFILKQGKNPRELKFPIVGLPKDARTYKVRLVGTLPKSGYDHILSSETLVVEVKKDAGK